MDFQQERYAKGAAGYDERIRKLFPFYETIHTAINAVLRVYLVAESELLIVGAGTGAEILELGKTNPGWGFLGVDPARPMLDLAKKKIEAAGLTDRVCLFNGFVGDLPIGKLYDGATSALKTNGIPDDTDVLGRTDASNAATAVERVLHHHLLLLCIFVKSLAAACVLAAIIAGCASPVATDRRDATDSASPPAEASAAAGPRFAQGGPDAEDYGASQGYPVGDRETCSRLIFLVGCHSHLDRIYEGRVVRRAATPSPLARATLEPGVRYEYQGQTFTVDDYLARNPATGLLVARGDTIFIERYQYARHDRHRFTSWSMAKTVTSMLVGIAAAEGRIRSVDDPAAVYVPALVATEYGRTSLRHLLQMSSGVRFVEEYTGQDDVSRLAADTFRQVGSGGVEAVTPFNVRAAPPGTKFSYASVETQVLGLVLRNAVGRPVADYLQEKIWEPMGAEADATWLIDRSGQEATYCCLNAVARDYARLGLLLAHDGHWRGRQIIPAAWIDDATRVRPDQPHLQPGDPDSRHPLRRSFGYGYQVWIFAGERRMFALLGIRGQAIFVDPASRLVMVQTAVRKQPRDPGVGESVALWRSVVQQLGH